MHKKSNGTTLVEVLVSVALISIVLIFVFNILADLKNEYSIASKRSEDAIARASYTRIIQNDFIAKELTDVSSCSKSGDTILCLDFKYKDGSTKQLKVNKTSVIYDDEIWKLSIGQYLTEGMRICFKEVNSIIDQSSLSAAKKTEIKTDSKVSPYHLLKIYVPTVTSSATNKKYNFEVVHISPYKLNFSVTGYDSQVTKCE